MSLENKLNNNDTRLKPTVRTNSPNIPGGTYNIPKASNIHGTNNYNSGVLKNLKGDTIKQTISPYDEKTKYEEQFKQPLDLEDYYSSNKGNNSSSNTTPSQTQVDKNLNDLMAGNIPKLKKPKIGSPFNFNSSYFK